KANAGSNKRSNHRASQGEFFNNISPNLPISGKWRTAALQQFADRLAKLVSNAEIARLISLACR
uniref:hypothetical protein n=1 Tax=uncultured Tateyamaria sp. TaxID=455651 RepID=UPI00260FA885